MVVGEEGGFGLLKEDLLYKEVIPNLCVCIHETPFFCNILIKYQHFYAQCNCLTNTMLPKNANL